METLEDLKNRMKDMETEVAFFRKTIVGKNINYVPQTQKFFYLFSIILLILIVSILFFATRSVIKIETAMAPFTLELTEYDQTQK